MDLRAHGCSANLVVAARPATAARRAAAWQRVDRLGRDALDARAEVAQALVDALVAAVDLADVADLRAPVGAQRGDQHRHAGADVGRLDALAAQPRRAR